ncbi:hypothetical protein D3C87_793290 [compost metagenome]
MSHNLNYNNGTHSFFSVKEKAWHGLGTIVEAYPTSAEALKFAGLDYSNSVRQEIFCLTHLLTHLVYALFGQKSH